MTAPARATAAAVDTVAVAAEATAVDTVAVAAEATAVDTVAVAAADTAAVTEAEAAKVGALATAADMATELAKVATAKERITGRTRRFRRLQEMNNTDTHHCIGDCSARESKEQYDDYQECCVRLMQKLGLHELAEQRTKCRGQDETL